MQAYSLTVDKFLAHAAKWFHDREIIGADRGEVAIRTDYARVHERSNRLSGALRAMGLGEGDRVATLAWNTPHHLEFYYATMGVGLVCHTLNPRLTVAHLAAAVDEAGDRLLAVASDLLPLAREVAAAASGSIEHIVVLDGTPEDDAPIGTMPLIAHDALIEEHGRACRWGEFDENVPAGLCYTSGTTGRPKGVVYTHRSNYLHTIRSLQADAFALTTRDVLLVAVPLFHANGWGLPFAAPAAGSKLILPGRQIDGASLAKLIVAEGVTVAVGVQTVWLALADHLAATGGTLPSLGRIIIGGSACPEALIRRLKDQLGVTVQSSWGMTELSPLGAITPRGNDANDGAGRPPMGLDLKLTDADGHTLPNQRGVEGYLKVSGHSVVDAYFGADHDALDADGYFDTGDLATIDRAGNLRIGGRAKDLIKSGGEWINPTEIEAIVGRHPAVRHVAVIGRSDPKWGERPVLIVETDGTPKAPALLAMLQGEVAAWWIPNDVVTIDQMPLAASGKIDKNRLRTDFAAGRLRGKLAA